MTQSIANAVLVAFEGAALWLAWHFLWRRSCQEVLRQRLFSLRDELFDFAREGNVDFRDPGYVVLRASINSVIRFSHQISVTRLFTFVVLQSYIKNPEAGLAHRKIASAIAQSPGKRSKEKLSEIHNRMYAEIARHLLLSSPHFVVLTPILICVDTLLSPGKPNDGRPKRLRAQGAVLIEAQAGEAFKTERVLRAAVAHPVAV